MMDEVVVGIVREWYPNITDQAEIQAMMKIWKHLKEMAMVSKDGTLEITVRDRKIYRISSKSDHFPDSDLTPFLR